MKRQSKRVLLMAILIVCAMAVTLVGFVLPLNSAKIFATKVTLTGVDYIRLISSLTDLGAVVNYPGMMVYVALILAALGLVAGGISAAVRKRGMLIAPLVLTLGAAVSMFLFLQDLLKNAGIGFYLFMGGNVVAVVCAVIGLIPVKAEMPQVVPVVKPVPMPETRPQASATICAKCGNQLQAGVRFCRDCGTPVAQAPVATMPKLELENLCSKCGERLQPGVRFCRTCGAPVAQAPVAQTPVEQPSVTQPPAVQTPAPVAPKAEAGNACRKCGTGLMADAKFCAVCATPVVEISVEDYRCSKCNAELKPGARFCVRCASQIENPIRETVTLGEGEKKAVCPYCGTRQSARNLRCRTCGTAMR